MVTSPRATHCHSMFPLSPSLMTNFLRLARENPVGHELPALVRMVTAALLSTMVGKEAQMQ